ncbi:MAG: lysophospholipid acyltransferase family protein [Acidimicrobiia bacterium]
MRALLEYFGYRLAAAVCGLLPEPLMRQSGNALGSFAFSRADGRKRMAFRHLTRALGSESEIEAACRRAFAAYGRYWAEVFWVRPRRVPGMLERISVEGLDRVKGAQAAGRGMIFVLPHIGNWEVAGTVAHDLGLELIAVAEDLPNPRLARWFAGVRKALGIDIVFADGSPRTIAALVDGLRRGAAIALVTDRNVRVGGSEVEFFGETTELPSGAALLAARFDVPVFPVAAFFANGPGHRVVIEAPVEMPTGGADRVAVGTQRIANALEGLIRRDPTQWHILQPNWPSDRTAR